MSTIKICFVAHNAYAALAKGNIDHIGGIERQQVMMARWLVDKGHEVSMITWGRREPSEDVIDGIRLHYLCRQSDGFPVVRFFHPRWTSLIRAMRKADADIYYYNLGDLALGQVVAWARKAGKAAVYSVSSESVCHADLRQVLSLRERLFYVWGLGRIEDVFVQTARQSELLAKNYDKSARILAMPCADISAAKPLAQIAASGERPRAVWVGRISKEKRPAWIIELARLCPNIDFDVVGGANRDTDYAKEFLQQAETLDNVNIRGVVQHEAIADVYRNANVMLCTSEYEGFPNVFLEAWSLGLPAVTSFDPDNIVSQQEIGVVGSDVATLADGLQNVLEDGSMWLNCSANARKYFVENHQIDAAMQGFETALQDVVASTAHQVT